MDTDAEDIPALGSIDAEHRLKRWPMVLGAVGVTVLVATGVAVLLRCEPRSLTQGVVTLVMLAVCGAMIAVAAALVWRRRRGLAVGALAVWLATGFMIVEGAEALHWRWSRAEFAEVVEGGTLSCSSDRPCRLGWWSVVGVRRYASIVVVVLPPNFDCYAGRGLAFPSERGLDNREIETLLFRDGVSYVSASGWRDGWFELCFTT